MNDKLLIYIKDNYSIINKINKNNISDNICYTALFKKKKSRYTTKQFIKNNNFDYIIFTNINNLIHHGKK